MALRASLCMKCHRKPNLTLISEFATSFINFRRLTNQINDEPGRSTHLSIYIFCRFISGNSFKLKHKKRDALGTSLCRSNALYYLRTSHRWITGPITCLKTRNYTNESYFNNARSSKRDYSNTWAHNLFYCLFLCWISPVHPWLEPIKALIPKTRSV